MTAHRFQCGFTYLALLFGVVVMGVALAAVGEIWSTIHQREKEKDLLFVGREFRRAIASYYGQAPGGRQELPRKLEDLVEDDRFPAVRRHLRRIYLDPMTGNAEWGLLRAGDRIVGVYSLSERAPIKQAGFRGDDQEFEGAASYRDWKFAYAVAAPQPAPPSSPFLAATAALTQPSGAAGQMQPGPASNLIAAPQSPNDEPCVALRAEDLRTCTWASGSEKARCGVQSGRRYAACQQSNAIPPLGVAGR